MFLILTVTLLMSYLFITIFVYNNNLNLVKSNVQDEAKYIAFFANVLQEDFLDEIQGIDSLARITYLDKDGVVLFDTAGDMARIPSRLDSEEIELAIRDGSGDSTRVSDTLGVPMYYYAISLYDERIIRVSKTIESLEAIALSFLPIVVGLFLLMAVVVWILSKWQVARLIEPINKLDIENPLENKTYAELMPLLEAIDQKNTESNLIADMRKEFSANVSHELKTPLTSISGYAEIIMNGMVRPDDIPAFSERIFKEAKRLIALIDDTIKLSRLDEGGLESEKEEIDFYDLCREIINRLAPQAENDNIKMELTGESVNYPGIRHLIDEMVYNLCENAIKYNAFGGEVYVWTGKTKDGTVIRVSDTGIGIPKEDLDRVFERFYRVDKSHSKETGGTGLGLSIVKHVAALHDAKIAVESKVNKGTKIEVLFPFV